MSTKIVWTERFSVGNAALDRQHMRLLAICNKLLDCANSADGEAHFREILNELGIYARDHFHAEEALMRMKGFPDFDAHCAEHRRYDAILSKQLLSFTHGEFDPKALQAFVTGWWTEHILSSDMDYRHYLRDPAQH